jgi:hypothetical protein
VKPEIARNAPPDNTNAGAPIMTMNAPENP